MSTPLARITPASRSRYRIVDLIGMGQFGRVYCAVDRQTGQFVAMKNLPLRRFPTPLFLRELRLLVELDHPNIVGFQAADYSQQGRYLVMDYCEGGTLRDVVERKVPFAIAQKLSLIADILRGLDHAQQSNIVHCDLKPENILLTLTPQGWKAKISDFGIARLQQEVKGSVMGQGATGSPAYMAPERFYGKFSIQSDLYAVGVMLYEILVGERPFSGLPGELMSAHLNQSIEVPEAVPFMLRSVITTALQKLPTHRFGSADEMLQPILLAIDVLTHPATPGVQGSSSAIPVTRLIPTASTSPSQAPLKPLDSTKLPLLSTDGKWFVRQLLRSSDTTPAPDSPAFELEIGYPRSHLPRRRITIPHPASHLILLDRHHALVVIPVENEFRTEFWILTRKGHRILNLSVPRLFQQVIPHPTQPQTLFVLSQSVPQPQGMILTLRPYRLSPCSLGIVPTWIYATAWGVLGIQNTGQVTTLNWQGQLLHQMQIALRQNQRITAVTVIKDWELHFAIADALDSPDERTATESTDADAIATAHPTLMVNLKNILAPIIAQMNQDEG